jgi:TetR/AcrR family transcriptional regulator, mexJK operon transcriptional repressor
MKQNSRRRKQILKAALRAFAKYGFEKATIKQIAAEAGLATTSLIYWYFKDKKELFKAVINEVSPLIKMASDPAEIKERPPEEVLPFIGRLYLDAFEDKEVTRLFRIFLSEAARRPEVGVQFAKNGIMVVLDFLTEYLRCQSEIGAIRKLDPQSTARAFIGTLVTYVLMREIFPSTKQSLPDRDRYIEEVTAIFLQGLRV